MATSKEYIDFVCEQIEGIGDISTKKMFGEYMVYLGGKPVLTVCDNTVFVKKLPELSELMAGADCGLPFDGAKEQYILDIENREAQILVFDHVHLAVLREVAELAYYEASDGVIVALGEGDMEHLVELVYIGHAVDRNGRELI